MDRDLCEALREMDRLIVDTHRWADDAPHSSHQEKLDDLLKRLRRWRVEHQTALVRAVRQA